MVRAVLPRSMLWTSDAILLNRMLELLHAFLLAA